MNYSIDYNLSREMCEISWILTSPLARVEPRHGPQPATLHGPNPWADHPRNRSPEYLWLTDVFPVKTHASATDSEINCENIV
uniref:Uncharacterized protein n=1 Tax=Anguilla anguilla TaxID=7936 RepID=A0A0E9XUC7_ANGAN